MTSILGAREAPAFGSVAASHGRGLEVRSGIQVGAPARCPFSPTLLVGRFYQKRRRENSWPISLLEDLATLYSKLGRDSRQNESSNQTTEFVLFAAMDDVSWIRQVPKPSRLFSHLVPLQEQQAPWKMACPRQRSHQTPNCSTPKDTPQTRIHAAKTTSEPGVCHQIFASGSGRTYD